MSGLLETIDEFGELHFPETFVILTIDGIRKRKLELCDDGKIKDCKKRKYREITV